MNLIWEKSFGFSQRETGIRWFPQGIAQDNGKKLGLITQPQIGPELFCFYSFLFFCLRIFILNEMKQKLNLKYSKFLL